MSSTNNEWITEDELELYLLDDKHVLLHVNWNDMRLSNEFKKTLLDYRFEIDDATSNFRIAVDAMSADKTGAFICNQTKVLADNEFVLWRPNENQPATYRKITWSEIGLIEGQYFIGDFAVYSVRRNLNETSLEMLYRALGFCKGSEIEAQATEAQETEAQAPNEWYTHALLLNGEIEIATPRTNVLVYPGGSDPRNETYTEFRNVLEGQLEAPVNVFGFVKLCSIEFRFWLVLREIGSYKMVPFSRGHTSESVTVSKSTRSSFWFCPVPATKEFMTRELNELKFHHERLMRRAVGGGEDEMSIEPTFETKRRNDSKNDDNKANARRTDDLVLPLSSNFQSICDDAANSDWDQFDDSSVVQPMVYNLPVDYFIETSVVQPTVYDPSVDQSTQTMSDYDKQDHLKTDFVETTGARASDSACDSESVDESLHAIRSNPPHPVHIYGRNCELDALGEKVEESSLVSVCGPEGSGKSLLVSSFCWLWLAQDSSRRFCFWIDVTNEESFRQSFKEADLRLDEEELRQQEEDLRNYDKGALRPHNEEEQLQVTKKRRQKGTGIQQAIKKLLRSFKELRQNDVNEPRQSVKDAQQNAQASSFLALHLLHRLRRLDRRLSWIIVFDNIPEELDPKGFEDYCFFPKSTLWWNTPGKVILTTRHNHYAGSTDLGYIDRVMVGKLDPKSAVAMLLNGLSSRVTNDQDRKYAAALVNQCDFLPQKIKTLHSQLFKSGLSVVEFYKSVLTTLPGTGLSVSDSQKSESKNRKTTC